MTAESFKFLTTEEFELLEQREKVAYLERAVEVLRAFRGGKVLSRLGESKKADSLLSDIPGATALETYD
jgi:hypothetical protein